MANSTMTRDGEAWGISVPISLGVVLYDEEAEAAEKSWWAKMLLGRSLLLPPQAHRGSGETEVMMECSHPLGLQR